MKVRRTPIAHRCSAAQRAVRVVAVGLEYTGTYLYNSLCTPADRYSFNTRLLLYSAYMMRQKRQQRGEITVRTFLLGGVVKEDVKRVLYS